MRYIGKLILVLITLGLEGTLVWTAYNTFSHRWASLNGAIIIIATLIGLIIFWKIIHSRTLKHQRPKLFPTFLLLVILSVILSFTGVQPLANYKDYIIDKWNEYQIAQAEQPTTNPTSVTIKPTTKAIIPTSAIPEVTLVNPSWEQLKSFLLADKTDELPYRYPTFVCDDFANTLQKNAEAAGWKCAKVVVQLSGYPDWYKYGIPSDTGHSCNAFQTTDRGLVYIDCTGLPDGTYNPGNCDKTVNIEIGKDYVPQSIFGFGLYWQNCGKVTNINVQW